MEWLKNFLKHWFVPHPGNDHQPHILRTTAAAVLIIVALFAEGALLTRAPGFKHSGFLGDILNSVLVDETNQNRTQADLASLKTSPLLEAAAAAKAQDMAAKSYFAHTSPEGITPWYWFDKVGYRYAYAGENLAVDFTDSQDVTTAWMNSPGHRANILNSHFTEIGIATAQGTFQGHPTTFVVQLFGAPAAAPVVAAPTPASSSPVVAAATSAGPAVLSETSEPAPAPVIVPAPTPLPTKPQPKPQVIAKKPAPVAAATANPEQTFVAVENPMYVTSSATSGVAAAASPSDESRVEHPTPLDVAIANPSRTMNVFTWFLVLLVATAIAIKLFHVGFAYPRLIMNGLVVLIVLTAILALNQAHFVAVAQVL